MHRPARRLALCCSCLLVMIGCTRAGSFSNPLYNAEITFKSGALKIHGLLSKPPGRGPFPLLLFCPGTRTPARNLASYMDLFTTQGYVTIGLDFRGVGRSEGTYENCKGEVDDALNALEFARGLPYVDLERIGIWGGSAGATIALLTASRSPAVRAVMALQGPVEMADCYRSWLQKQGTPNPEAQTQLLAMMGGTPEQVPEEWKVRSPLYVADRIQCPVLLVYSDRDEKIPVDQGTRMEAALKKSGNKAASLVMVAGVGHGLDSKTWAEVNPTTVSFFERELVTNPR